MIDLDKPSHASTSDIASHLIIPNSANFSPNLQRQHALLNWVNDHIATPISSLTDISNDLDINVFTSNLLGSCDNAAEKTEGSEQWRIVPEHSRVPKGAQEILIFLSSVYAQYQAHTLCLLQDDSSVHLCHLSPVTTPEDVSQALIEWSQAILFDYASENIISLVQNCNDSWKDGLGFLAILHYFDPSLVPDLDTHMVAKDSRHTLSTAFSIAHDSFQIPRLLDPSLMTDGQLDTLAIQGYLVEVVKATHRCSPSTRERRHGDIMRWKISLQCQQPESSCSATPSLSSNSGSETGDDSIPLASTAPLLQNVHVSTTVTAAIATATTTTATSKISTKTTLKYPDGEEVPIELEEFETRVTALLGKAASFRFRLENAAPSRSKSYHRTKSTSITPETKVAPAEESDEQNTQVGTDTEALSHPLHPLEAGEQDMAAYRANVQALDTSYHLLCDNDLADLRHYIATCLDPMWHNNSRLLERMKHVDETFCHMETLVKSQDQILIAFCRGYDFAQTCSAIRSELDLIQTKMVKSTTTDHDIQDLEHRVEMTQSMIDTTRSDFTDLLDGNDVTYTLRLEAIVSKHDLVRSWVEEVRVWFAEAERIREWISIRHTRLDETFVPEPFASHSLPANREQVTAWNAHHTALESEIHAFDEEDMGRLRSHVKALTGVGRIGKDLSPADTTTIEITLTTLTALDKLMHLLRQKSYRLQLLTLRHEWEEELASASHWIQSTDIAIDTFFLQEARWTPHQEGEGIDTDDKVRQEDNETVIQRLLAFEHDVSEFERDQYTQMVNKFQDLDDVAHIALPDFLEDRQVACEHDFVTMRKRLEFVRKVVEQRLNLTDFLSQVQLVKQDAELLREDLKNAEASAEIGQGNSDAISGLIQRVHDVRDTIFQLVKSVANRIPFPVPDPIVAHDDTDNQADEKIKGVISLKQDELDLLSVELQDSLKSLNRTIQLQQEAKQLYDEAESLCQWSTDRIKQLSDIQLSADTCTLDDVNRLESDRDTLSTKLSSRKDNEVNNLIARIREFTTQDDLTSKGAMNHEQLAASTLQLSTVSTHLLAQYEQLRKALALFDQKLRELRKLMEDGQSNTEMAHALQAFINETRASIPGLKQAYGFISGRSSEKDSARLDQFDRSLGTLKDNLSAKHEQLNLLQSRITSATSNQSKGNNDVGRLQDHLEKGWSELELEMTSLCTFRDTVQLWRERHQQLDSIEHDLLPRIDESCQQISQPGPAVSAIQTVRTLLRKVIHVLKTSGTDVPGADMNEDPIQIANASCVRDRHSALWSRVESIQALLSSLARNAAKAEEHDALLIQLNELMTDISHATSRVHSRLAAARRATIDMQDTEAIQQLVNVARKATQSSENDRQLFYQRREAAQMIVKELVAKGHDEAVWSHEWKNVNEALSDYEQALSNEKECAVFMRNVQVHTKGAKDLLAWMTQCSKVISDMPADMCLSDETELRFEWDKLQHKMLDMAPTVQKFRDMTLRLHTIAEELVRKELLPQDTTSHIMDQERTVLDSWSGLLSQLEQAMSSIERSRKDIDVAHAIKEILVQVGDLKGRTAAIRLVHRSLKLDSDSSSELKAILTCPLSLMPTEHEALVAKTTLDTIDKDIEQHLQSAIQELDSMLASDANTKLIFAGQRAEISEAVWGLTTLVQAKRQVLTEVMTLEPFLIVTEELEVLLSALSEVVDRASVNQQGFGHEAGPSRADLQAMLIDLETRFQYYEPKIEGLIREAEQVGKPRSKDVRVIHCLEELNNRWLALQSAAKAKQSELRGLIGPRKDLMVCHSTHLLSSRERNRKAMSMVSPRIQRSTTPSGALPPRPQSMMLMSRDGTMDKRVPPSARKESRPNTAAGGYVSPSPRVALARAMALQRLQDPPSSRRTTRTSSPETYVADPKNDLDMAMGDIINDSPYKIKIKMVPGEVGRYWFGDKTPKLAYCRILRSRMVMVRVGGGWVELSQFLRDHALLNNANIVTRGRQLDSEVIQEGYFQTSSPNACITMRGGHGPSGAHDRSTKGTHAWPPRESRSTPFHHRLSPLFGHGVKQGNKFVVTVDNHGNQVEVKMTKAKSRDTTAVTPRRRVS